MQVLPSPAASGFNPLAVKMHSLSRAMRSIVAEEGVYGLWRGVPSVLLGAGWVPFFFLVFDWGSWN